MRLDPELELERELPELEPLGTEITREEPELELPELELPGRLRPEEPEEIEDPEEREGADRDGAERDGTEERPTEPLEGDGELRTPELDPELGRDEPRPPRWARASGLQASRAASERVIRVSLRWVMVAVPVSRVADTQDGCKSGAVRGVATGCSAGALLAPPGGPGRGARGRSPLQGTPCAGLRRVHPGRNCPPCVNLREADGPANRSNRPSWDPPFPQSPQVGGEETSSRMSQIGDPIRTGWLPCTWRASNELAGKDLRARSGFEGPGGPK
jgi:hypothetical protein